VTLEQGFEFLLERNLRVMDLLIADVVSHQQVREAGDSLTGL
jgi:hypothetical protein